MASAIEQARAIFERVDVSKDGVVDKNELGRLLQELGEEPTPQNIVRALFQMDTSGDGTISLDEFIAFYKSNYLPTHPVKMLSTRRGHVDIGHAKSASYSLPPPTFCFGKALQRDKENAGQVMRQHGDAGDDGGVVKSTRKTAKSMQIRPKTAPATASKTTEARQACHPSRSPRDPGIDFILVQLKRQLQQRGYDAFEAIAEQSSSTSSLSLPAFKTLLQTRLGLDVTPKDLRAIFSIFDADGNGSISAAEWAAAMLTPLSGVRLAAVELAFQKLDVHEYGTLSVKDLRAQFHGDGLPDVRSGLKTLEEARAEVLTALCSARATVSRDQFMQYYTRLSSATADDALFVRTIEMTWQIEVPPVRATTAKPKDSKFCRVQAPWLSTDSASSLLYCGGTNASASAVNLPAPPLTPLKELDAGLKGTLARVRNQLKTVGFAGWRAFDVAGNDPTTTTPASAALTLPQFKALMKDNAAIVLSDKDWRHIFDFFASQHTATLDLNRLWPYIYEPMSVHRLGLVRRVFRQLDCEKNGWLLLDDVVASFDAARHPNVQAGHTSEDEIVQALRDAMGPGPQVSLAQFERYYGYLSQSIVDDSAFEKHVTSVWHDRFPDAAPESRAKITDRGTTPAVEKKDPLVMYQESLRYLDKQLAQKAPPPTTTTSRRTTKTKTTKRTTATAAAAPCKGSSQTTRTRIRTPDTNVTKSTRRQATKASYL
ncbi:hypothetical protein Ae201684P_013365 [Aphanomyces euteiches]|uniref:EF-hand domain-containing protein n=1 Tax=Aphanomyces euteiches TaxID=100861 RepID=A0A6G0WCQ9_9STRA|nr:hypothetical protein Ae201684_016260 [Aphanomyces euteiches]KAH9095249.1 hypothetical protein Ae201684P_013365 [Aphanomyces euteiches]KAH9153475.1 hypothetical protein AeRB84_004281 [Aphanomyces euteiches]